MIHARNRPDPVPTAFGYHELFHLLAILGAAVQYELVAFWVLVDRPGCVVDRARAPFAC